MSRSKKILALSIGEGINLLLGFFLVPYLARAMSLSEYGTYGQVLLIVTSFVRFLGFGFNKVLFTDFAIGLQSKATILKSNIFIVSCFGLFGSFILFFFRETISNYFENPELTYLILIYCFVVPFALIQSSLMSTLVYFGRVNETVVINVFTNLIRLLLVLISVQFFHSLSGIFLSLLLIPVIQMVLFASKIPFAIFNEGAVNKNVILGQLKDGIPLGLTVLISTLFYTVDGLMISRMMDVESFALFRNGAIFIPIVASLYGAVNTIVLPDVTKMYAANKINELTELKSKALHNTAALIYPIVLFFVFHSFIIIPLYLSEKYASSFIVFSLYNLILLFRVTSYDDIFIATKKTKKLPYIYGIALLSNLIINALLISYYGINGAALGSLLSFIILVSCLISGSVKILEIKLSDLFSVKKLLTILTIPLIISLASIALYYITLNLFIIGLMFMAQLFLSYHFFLKLKILDILLFRSIIEKYDFTGFLIKFINRHYI